MELDGLTGKVHKVTEWLMAIVVTNLLWFLFNLPIAYLGFMLLIVDNMQEIIALVVYIGVLTPIMFFPATTAMFAVLRYKILFPDEDIGIFKLFWKHWKQHYIQSLLGGAVLTFVWLILVIDGYFFVNRVHENFLYLFIVIGFFMLVMTLHFFSVTVHVHTQLFQGMKNALIISLVNPLLTLILGLASLVIVYSSFHVSTFLIPFFLGSLIAYISFFGFHRFFTKIIDQRSLSAKG
ncbi:MULTISPECIES: YesL family protein [Gracilibacillus]|uniref:YesL family protein n=1 Tax=Gracilibacillus TaxID=74385 RepID=UPI0008246E2B|nr:MULTISPECIES: DUF624 domain-containing protein [Gracilibacillus]